jgi:Concanavalin A-like lectin/glucanases superfamily/Secretion system C-terminal sorting domain/HYR domain
MKTIILPHTFKAAMVLLLFMVAFVQKSFAQAIVIHETVPLYPSTIVYGSDNNLVYALKMTVNNLLPMPVSFSSVTFTVNGAYQGNQLKNPSFSAYLSTDAAYDAADMLIGHHSLSNGSNETITISSVSSQMIMQTAYILITTNLLVPPLNEDPPNEGGRKSSVLIGNMIINGATNPVQLSYLPMFGPPPTVTNNQANLAGEVTFGTTASGGGVIPPAPTPISLVANYSFCNNANDTSPNANNAIVNGATLTSDRFENINSAYSFDGNDYIEVLNNSALQLGTGDYSVSYWFKSNHGNVNQGMIMKMDGGNNYAGITQYYMGGAIQARSENANAVNSNISNLNNNQWHHIAYTRSGSVQKLYIDGLLDKTVSGGNIANISNSKPLHFGKWNESEGQYFNGALDDIKIYSGALSESEIAAEFNATSTSGCTPVVCPTITVATGVNFQRTCDGMATLTANGGAGDYTYSILNGTGGSIDGISLSGLGTYTIQATDANGCTGSVSVILTKNDDIAPIFTNCPGDITETADANCTKVVTWPLPTAMDNCNTAPETIAGYTFKGSHNGKNYYLADASTNFATAKAAAETVGAKLLVINNAAENSFITSLGGTIQLGITDAATEGTWLDMDGNAAPYFNWNSGEPNNASGGDGEDYANTNAGGWNDHVGGTAHYMIEKGPAVVLTSALGSGSTFATGTHTVSYMATDASGNTATCSFRVTVNPSITAEISYAFAAVCTNSGEKTVTITGAQNGTFSVMPATGLSVNTTNGTINTLNATPGDYTITYTIAASGSCPAITDNFVITVNAAPAITCPQPMEVCKNEAIFSLPNIPAGATITVGGVANTNGKFDPSADLTAYYDGDGNANVPLVYSITQGACSASCSYNILVKRLPASNSTVVPEVNGQINGQTVNICKNSTETVNVLFGGSYGSMAPITFSYTLNGVLQPDLVTGSAVGGIPISTATAGSFVYHLTKVKINTGCEMAFDKTATVNILDLPVTTLSGPAFPLYCLGSTVPIPLTITSSSTGIISGTLSDGTPFSGTSPITVNVKPNETTVYTLATVNGGTCSSNNSGYVHVSVQGPLTVEVNHTQLSFCQNSDAKLPVRGTGLLGGGNCCFSITYQINNGPILTATTTSAEAYLTIPSSTPGQYTVKVIEALGSYCPSPINEEYIITISPVTNVNISGSGTYCEGENTATTLTISSSVAGTITGTLSDGSTFSGTSPITVTKSPAQTTTYTIATINGSACPGINSGSATITVNRLADPDAWMYFEENGYGWPTMSKCQNSGDVLLKFDGGRNATGPYTYYYSINNGPELNIVSNGGSVNADLFISTSTSGTFTYKLIRIKTGNGCESVFDKTAILTVSPINNVSISGSGTYCEGENTSTTLTITSSVAGAISGTLSDGSTFSGTSPITVIKSPAQTTTYTIASVSGTTCSGTNTGAATITVKPKPVITCPQNQTVCINQLAFELGAEGTYSGNGVENNMFDPATAGLGNHAITLSKTVGGCTSTCTFTIAVSAPPQITINSGSGTSTCVGGNNYVSIYGVGGYTGYSIEYNINGGTTQTLSTGDGFITIPIDFNTPGIYLVTVTKVDNASGCPNTTPQTITITIKAKPTVTCPANMSKTITDASFALTGASPAGGIYAGTGVSAGMFSPATAGVGVHIITYTVTENGCSNSCSFTITVTGVAPCNVTLSTFTATTVCQPFPIPLSFTGLVPNTVNIITMKAQEILLPFRSYQDQVVTVTADASGNANTTINVDGYGTIDYFLTIKEIKIGDCILNPTANNIAYFTKKPQGGGQSVDITEASICSGATLHGIIGVVQNYAYNTNFSYNITLLGSSTPAVTGTFIGTPLGYQTLQFTVPNVVLPSGSYNFRITAQNIDGCGTSANYFDGIIVNPVPTLTATAVITNLDCNNSAAMGAINQTIGGGSGAYTYAWSNGAITEDVSGLASGNYSVTITDAASCGSPTLVKSYAVTKPAVVVVSASSNTQACNGANGTALLSATGGNGGYSFASSVGGSVSGNSFAAPAGTYLLTATDVNSCTGTLSITITECIPSLAICTNTQYDYGNANHTACTINGSFVPVGTLMSNALNGANFVFGLPTNNRTFTLIPADISVGGTNAPIYNMLASVSNASSKFALGGASYNNLASWSKVPLTNTGKMANILFANTTALFFNLKNSANLGVVPFANIMYSQPQTACGSGIGTGIISNFQMPTGVVAYLQNPANGYTPNVTGLFNLANDALGGKVGVPNLSTIASAAEKINKTFNGCRLLSAAPSPPVVFGTGLRCTANNLAINGPSKGGMFVTLIEGNPLTGNILGVTEIGENGLAGFAPVINNSYTLILGIDPEGSRIPQSPIGYKIIGTKVNYSNSLVSIGENSTNDFRSSNGEVQIGSINLLAGSRMAISNSVEVEFIIEASAPLPVRLVSFDGKPTEKGNLLEWKTSSEENFSYFEVERSSPLTPGGGISLEKFVKIGVVKCAGNIKEKLAYSYLDNQAIISQANSNANQTSSPIGVMRHSDGGGYYRLRMVDLDGKSDYSKTIFIKSDSETEIKVYPNPATDFVNVENIFGKILSIKILDEFGREIKTVLNSSAPIIKIDVDGISSGVYFMQINDGVRVNYKKVVLGK